MLEEVSWSDLREDKIINPGSWSDLRLLEEVSWSDLREDKIINPGSWSDLRLLEEGFLVRP